MKARKLLTPSTLEELGKLTELGVPVAKAMRSCKLEGLITRPTVCVLLNIYVTRYEGTTAEFIEDEASLFPEWLAKDGDAVQEQPEGWDYVGYFPQGYWEASTKD